MNETPISDSVKNMEIWINSGNTISDYFLKKRLGFDDDMIKYYLDHKVLFRRIDGNYILNRG